MNKHLIIHHIIVKVVVFVPHETQYITATGSFLNLIRWPRDCCWDLAQARAPHSRTHHQTEHLTFFPSWRGGATSSWWLSKSPCINSTKSFLMEGFFSKLCRRDISGWKAYWQLFGRYFLGRRKGRGATQWRVSYLWNPLSISCIKTWSSTEGACWWSFSVFWKTVSPRWCPGRA